MGHAPSRASRAQPIYLDYNATTPLRKEVIQKMKPYLECFGNPSSNHAYGDAPRAALNEARMRVAQAINSSPDSIYFCSCGTEADNWAIWSAICTYSSLNSSGKKPHILSTVIEHPAVIKYLEHLSKMGMCQYTLMDVSTPEGFLERQVLETSIQENTCLLTVMHSNNEIGTIQDFSMISEVVKNENIRRGESQPPILLHSDMAQSVGRCHIDVQSDDMMIDMGTIVAHKFGGPKGVAALYIRPGVHALPFLHGGGQEKSMRSGTECVLLIAGMGEAIYHACKDVDTDIAGMREKRDLLKKLMDEYVFDDPRVVCRIHGTNDPKRQLPNTLSFSIRGVDSKRIISNLGNVLAISAGSACHSSDSAAGGSVLQSIGCPEDLQTGTFRVSVGHFTTISDVRNAAIILSNAIKEELKLV